MAAVGHAHVVGLRLTIFGDIVVYFLWLLNSDSEKVLRGYVGTPQPDTDADESFAGLRYVMEAGKGRAT